MPEQTKKEKELLFECFSCGKKLPIDTHGNFAGTDFVGTPAYGSTHDFGGRQGLSLRLVVCDLCLDQHSRRVTVEMKKEGQTRHETFVAILDWETLYLEWSPAKESP